MNIDNAAIAQQLGYSREQMISKFGEPGQKSPNEICSSLGLDDNARNTIFKSAKDESSYTDYSKLSTSDLLECYGNKDNDAIAQALGYSKEEMEAKFGKPGEKSPEEIGSILGLATSFISNIFGKKDSSESTNTKKNETSTKNNNNKKTSNDTYQKVAGATGYDALTVSAIMKAVKSGNNYDSKQLAFTLGLPEKAVSDVLNYLNSNKQA